MGKIVNVLQELDKVVSLYCFLFRYNLDSWSLCVMNNNNNNNNLLHLGCHPVAGVILHVNIT